MATAVVNELENFHLVRETSSVAGEKSSIHGDLQEHDAFSIPEGAALVEDDQLLSSLFLSVLRELNGEEIAEKVLNLYSVSAAYIGKDDPDDLKKAEAAIAALSPEENITVASAFSHMLMLNNLAEEVQMADRTAARPKQRTVFDEGIAVTESSIKDTFVKLLKLGKTKEEIFEALKQQTVDLVFTAHPTQSVRRSLLQKHQRVRACLTQLHASNISLLRKEELLEALRREIQAAWRTDEIRRNQPAPQDEMRAGMSYFHETIMKGLPQFLRRVDTALMAIGIKERLPYNTPLFRFSSWMGGDRDGNPRVTPDVTRDVCLLSRLMAANSYFNQIEDLMFELSMWRCNDELREYAFRFENMPDKREIKHYIEFWKSIPPNEPYRLVLSDVRDKLYKTRDRAQQLLMTGKTDIPESDTYTFKEQLLEPLEICYRSLRDTGDHSIADGTLLDFIRQVSCFGLALVALDIRQESERHTDVLDAITTHLGLGSYRQWSEEERVEFLVRELQGKRPLFGSDLQCSDECREVLDTFKVIAEIPFSSFGAYVISMATAPSDVLAVELLQRECGVTKTLRVVPLFERLDDLNNGPSAMESLFQNPWYIEHINKTHGMRQEIMIGYSDSGKDAGRLSAAWAMFKAQVEMAKVAEKYGVKLTMFHGRGGTVGRGGGPTHLAILSQPPNTINGSMRVTIQGEVIEQTFGEQLLCFRSLQRFTSAVLEHGMNPPMMPKPEWAQLLDEMSVVATEDYRGIVFQELRFVEYFRKATPEMEYGRMNIGSRPSKRKPGGGIETLRAIPWIFAWTQTRFHLPVWLGVGKAFEYAVEKAPNNLQMLQEMYAVWPFFRVTVDLLEMVFAKGDPRVAALYDRLLVDEELRPFGEVLRGKYQVTKEMILKVAQHGSILEGNPYLRQRLLLREPYITPLNIQQALTLKKMREDGHQLSISAPPTPLASSGGSDDGSQRGRASVTQLNRSSSYSPGLEDTLIITMKGIAAGMQNTG